METSKQSVPMLFPYEPGHFWTQMRQIIQEEVARTNQKTEDLGQDIKLLGRKEVAQLLKISLVTLHDWMKRGLPFHKQRGRVYFIYSEVIEFLQTRKIGH